MRFTPEQARRFYDRFAAKQDSQAFYEDPAIRRMIEHSDFGSATSIFEFGCGTGRLAELLLSNHLPSIAMYAGVDISPVMIEIARRRLSRFANRISVTQTDGSTQLDAGSGSFDRFVSTYVFDLLSPGDAQRLLREAHRVLGTNGLICLVGLTRGFTVLTNCVSALWSAVYHIRPQLVGGCRPTRIAQHLTPELWEIQFNERVAPWGIPSQIVVAQRVS